MRPSHSQKNWLGELTERYHEALTADVLEYLASRGIDRDGATGLRLGLVTDPDPAHERYIGRLAIPFITPTGVVSMRFRCLSDHGEQDCSDLWHGKYEGLEGEETRLYNVGALLDATDTIGICEGELDAAVATLSGLPSVGVPGKNNFKPYYYRLFDEYERVILLGDGDSGGREFVASLSRNLNNSIRRPLPEGHDVTTYVMEHGPDAFLAYATD